MAPPELVSVLIPAYNAAKTIEKTLRSVQEQTYRSLEILVVDDGSTDDTTAIVERHVNSDRRVRLIRQTNGGVAAARNRGIAEAKGDYIAPLDADDLWAPTKIEKQMAAMRQGGPRVGLVYTWQATIDEEGKLRSTRHCCVYEGDVLPQMLRGNLVGSGSAALMRRQAVIEAGGYDPSLRARRAQGCEDMKLYIRIAARYEFAVVKECLTGYRIMAGTMSTDLFQMLRSFDLVFAEAEQAHPEQAGAIRKGRTYSRYYALRQALKAGQARSAAIFAWQMSKPHPPLALRLFMRLAADAARLLADRTLRVLGLRKETSPVFFPDPPLDRDAEPLTGHRTPKTGKPFRASMAFALRQIRRVAPLARGHAWAIPIMAVLSLGASFAETMTIAVVVLFLYTTIGPGTEALAAGGLMSVFAGAVEAVVGDGGLALALLIFVLVMTKAGMNLGYDLLTAGIKNAISEKARNEIYSQYLAVSYAYIRSRDQGELLNVLSRESWTVADAFFSMARIGANLVAITVFGVLLLAISWQITVIAALGSVLLFLCLRAFAGPGQRLGEAATRANHDLAVQSVNTLHGMRTIRAYAQEEFRDAQFRRASARARRNMVNMERLYSCVAPISEIIYLGMLAAVVWLASAWGIPFASALGAVGLLYRLQPHIREFEQHRLALAQFDASLSAVDSVVSRDDKTYAPVGSRSFAGLKDEIRFDRVSLVYPGADTPSLREASFSIRRGTTTAIVGPSGAGKTTIVNLLLRLYEPDGGEILVDGVRLDRLERTSWLDRISLAGQDAELIDDTIIGNIRLATADASPAEIERAVRLAGIDDFIAGLPKGLETWIGDQGVNMSGGQRQRLGLARALVRRPELLILDEATNAVDQGLEDRIRANVAGVMAGGTTIIITHRLDSIANVDHVIWLDRGRVVEHSTPPSLAVRAASGSARLR